MAERLKVEPHEANRLTLYVESPQHEALAKVERIVTALGYLATLYGLQECTVLSAKLRLSVKNFLNTYVINITTRQQLDELQNECNTTSTLLTKTPHCSDKTAQKLRYSLERVQAAKRQIVGSKQKLAIVQNELQTYQADLNNALSLCKKVITDFSKKNIQRFTLACKAKANDLASDFREFALRYEKVLKESLQVAKQAKETMKQAPQSSAEIERWTKSTQDQLYAADLFYKCTKEQMTAVTALTNDLMAFCAHQSV